MDRRKLATATLFGVLIAVVKSPFQFPVTDYLIIIEVPILGLSFLLLGKGGATYTGLVNGLLQSFVKVNFFPLDLIFGVSYGILVDVFATALSVKQGDFTSAKRMTAALAVASAVLGLGITYAFLALNINLGIAITGLTMSQLIGFVYAPIVIWGIASGALGGFVSVRIWERNLKARFGRIRSSIQP